MEEKKMLLCKKGLLFSLCLILSELLVPEIAHSLPQFPVRLGLGIYGEGDHHDHAHGEMSKTMDCRACHLNPTGGGIRNAHGKKFGIEQLPVGQSEKNQKEGLSHKENHSF